MPAGHPDLVAAISGEIRTSGPIPFARFMELALYHPLHGYYMRLPAHPGAQAIGEDRIGWSGDYYTSSDVHPILARALAKQIRQADELLGRPDPFTVVEMGGGKGLLARDFLRDCEGAGSFFKRLRYRLIERSPAMKAAQQANLAPWLASPGQISWLDDVGKDAGGLVGVVFSNELLDAFSVHRIRIDGGQPREIFVGLDGDRFVERLRPLSRPELAQYLRRLEPLGITLPEGYTTEINLHALRWMKAVARVLMRGLVITIDYGHTAQDLYGPDRHKGTLLCYYHQLASDDPYQRVGLQDMTAHVDFTSLAGAGEEEGLHVTGFTNQMSFLMGLGVEQMVEALEPGSPEFQSIIQLLRPEGMGRTFKILIQHKGVPRPDLDGLQFKPFFGEALAPPAAHRKEGGR